MIWKERQNEEKGPWGGGGKNPPLRHERKPHVEVFTCVHTLPHKPPARASNWNFQVARPRPLDNEIMPMASCKVTSPRATLSGFGRGAQISTTYHNRLMRDGGPKDWLLFRLPSPSFEWPPEPIIKWRCTHPGTGHPLGSRAQRRSLSAAANRPASVMLLRGFSIPERGARCLVQPLWTFDRLW
jgi:hypothetical protein